MLLPMVTRLFQQEFSMRERSGGQLAVTYSRWGNVNLTW